MMILSPSSTCYRVNVHGNEELCWELEHTQLDSVKCAPSEAAADWLAEKLG